METLSVFKNLESEARYLAAYDAVLAHWPIPYQAIELSTRLGETHIMASGSKEAPPLLLLPGNFDCSLSWIHSVESLSAANRVYALDTVGDVGKSKAYQLPANRDDFANWLDDILNGLHISAADLMGISYGGFLAVNYALKFKERVRRLVLLCPGIPLGPFTTQWMIRGMPMIFWPSIATVKWFIKGASTTRGQDDLLQVFIAGITGTRSMKVLRPSFHKDEWKQLQMPILLLVGDHEIMYEPVQAIRQAKQLIPHIQAELIENAGHFLLSDQADQINQRAIKFLNVNV